MVDVFNMNDCVCCPQGCRNCGRDKDYKVIVYTCDNCNKESEELILYKTESGRHYCEECFLKSTLRKMTVDAIIEEMEHSDTYKSFVDSILEDVQTVNEEYEDD